MISIKSCKEGPYGAINTEKVYEIIRDKGKKENILSSSTIQDEVISSKKFLRNNNVGNEKAKNDGKKNDNENKNENKNEYIYEKKNKNASINDNVNAKVNDDRGKDRTYIARCIDKDTGIDIDIDIDMTEKKDVEEEEKDTSSCHNYAFGHLRSQISTSSFSSSSPSSIPSSSLPSSSLPSSSLPSSSLPSSSLLSSSLPTFSLPISSPSSSPTLFTPASFNSSSSSLPLPLPLPSPSDRYHCNEPTLPSLGEPLQLKAEIGVRMRYTRLIPFLNYFFVIDIDIVISISFSTVNSIFNCCFYFYYSCYYLI